MEARPTACGRPTGLRSRVTGGIEHPTWYHGDRPRWPPVHGRPLPTLDCPHVRVEASRAVVSPAASRTFAAQAPLAAFLCERVFCLRPALAFVLAFSDHPSYSLALAELE